MKERQQHCAYLGLGTNLGERYENLLSASQSLMEKLKILEKSAVYSTPPWGVLDQPDFLNQVLLVETDLYPFALLAFLKNMEKQLGRVASIRYGPRLIDLDILFYDDLILDTPGLIIPHPQIEKRGFVLVPMADLAPDLIHPISGKTIRQLLENWCMDNDLDSIRIFEPG